MTVETLVLTVNDFRDIFSTENDFRDICFLWTMTVKTILLQEMTVGFNRI